MLFKMTFKSDVKRYNATQHIANQWIVPAKEATVRNGKKTQCTSIELRATLMTLERIKEEIFGPYSFHKRSTNNYFGFFFLA